MTLECRISGIVLAQVHPRRWPVPRRQQPVGVTPGQALSGGVRGRRCLRVAVHGGRTVCWELVPGRKTEARSLDAACAA